MNKPWSARHLRRRQATAKHKRKLVSYDRNLKWYPSPVYYNGRYYKRCYRSSHANSDACYVRRHCNKQVRRFTGDVGHHGFYRKMADYWWLLY